MPRLQQITIALYPPLSSAGNLSKVDGRRVGWGVRAGRRNDLTHQVRATKTACQGEKFKTLILTVVYSCRDVTAPPAPGRGRRVNTAHFYPRQVVTERPIDRLDLSNEQRQKCERASCMFDRVRRRPGPTAGGQSGPSVLLSNTTVTVLLRLLICQHCVHEWLQTCVQ